jgi:CheY-like chemotaxis protein
MGGTGFPGVPSLAGIHVLLVEDEPDARELLKVIIEYADGLVTAVGSARAALTALETLRPDVLLTDIVMPREDAYWLINEVRRLAHGQKLPAIAVTGRTRLHDRGRAVAAGFQAYLTKPVDPWELCRVIAEVTGRRA